MSRIFYAKYATLDLMDTPNAQTVITILKHLKSKLGPGVLAYWVTPNTILTLSGARAFCDGVFYSNDDQKILEGWQREIAKSIEVIKTVTDVYHAEAMIDTSATKERYAGYDMLLRDGLSHVLSQTLLISPKAKKALLKEDFSQDKLVELLEWWLYENEALKNFSKEDLRHVAFGILVGYPDKAILGSVQTWGADDTFAEPLIQADIRGARYYVCPQPIYDYPRHLVSDPDIVAHEKQWSTVLRDYYFSDFHKALEAEPEFQKRAKELELFY